MNISFRYLCKWHCLSNLCCCFTSSNCLFIIVLKYLLKQKLSLNWMIGIWKIYGIVSMGCWEGTRVTQTKITLHMHRVRLSGHHILFQVPETKVIKTFSKIFSGFLMSQITIIEYWTKNPAGSPGPVPVGIELTDRHKYFIEYRGTKKKQHDSKQKKYCRKSVNKQHL